MEDSAINWHHCQGMSLGSYEGEVFGYLCFIFVTCPQKMVIYFDDVHCTWYFRSSCICLKGARVNERERHKN